MTDTHAARKEYFAGVYRDNRWKDPESRSGPGSSLAATADLISGLPEVLNRLQVKTFLDLPCGDFNWMRHIPLPAALRYIGGDIVADIIERNRIEHAAPNREFQVLDIVSDPLPSADLIFVRDCFIHFSLELIQRALENIRRAHIPFIMMTHDTCDSRYPPAGNIDLDRSTSGVSYEYRVLNFTISPFNMPPPILTLGDGGQWDGHKTMAVWANHQLT